MSEQILVRHKAGEIIYHEGANAWECFVAGKSVTHAWSNSLAGAREILDRHAKLLTEPAKSIIFYYQTASSPSRLYYSVLANVRWEAEERANPRPGEIVIGVVPYKSCV